MSEVCFHCGLALPTKGRFQVTYQGGQEDVCCAGCQAVAELIISGQPDYYRFRQAPSARPDERMLANLSRWEAFADGGELRPGDDRRQLSIVVEGMHCAACAWLIEQSLGKVAGITEVGVDLISHRVEVVWRPQQVSLPDILKRLVRLGFRPHPANDVNGSQFARQERRAAIQRLGVAGLGMMQVMMYAVGTYFGPTSDMAPQMQRFFELVAMVITAPVLVYAGGPFFRSAMAALTNGRVNMDVPVALALSLAFSASCFNLWRGEGAVYFDSVTMFIFFLLLGRLVEMSVRQRAGQAIDALGSGLPEVAWRHDKSGLKPVAVTALQVGDAIEVRAGEMFPVDGCLLSRSAMVDEAPISGESHPLRRCRGEKVYAGAINLGSAVRVRVTQAVNQSLVAVIEQILRRARARRPPSVQLADQVAAYVVVMILLLALGVFLFWYSQEPERALTIALSVLVVTCPCALSLATPSALAAASHRLIKNGVLLRHNEALINLTRIDYIALDKTGTLTLPEFAVSRVTLNPNHPAPWTRQQVLSAVAALERYSAHPIASAFANDGDSQHRVEQVEETAGLGIAGQVNGRMLYVGQGAFIPDRNASVQVPTCHPGESWVFVADERGLIATIGVHAVLRGDTEATLMALRQQGLRLEIVSGDDGDAVAALARRLNIDQWQARLKPQAKLDHIRHLQAAGHRVLMLGDGVNDGPGIGGGDVSASFRSGTALAQSGADLVLLGEGLKGLVEAFAVARRTRRVIVQNLTWAFVYNGIAVPLAAAGWVVPWVAALGMSLSSLVVVLNAARIAAPASTLKAPLLRRFRPMVQRS